MSSFCRAFSATNENLFPAIESFKQSPLYKALHAKYATELVNVLYEKELMGREIIYLTPNQIGGRASHAAAPNMSPGVHPKKNGEGMTMLTRLRMKKLNTEYGRKRNLVRPMNGTAHLNPNAENNFITNCAAAKELFRKVSFHLSKLPLNQFY